jgi:DNA repair photolyase
MSSLQGFHQLLISRPARAEEHGVIQIERFRAADLPVHELDADADVLAHPAAGNPGSLLVLHAPPTGWITKAEHGILANRRGEHYLHPIAGCRSSCTYCYLRALPSGHRPLRLHVGLVGLGGLFAEIEQHLASATGPVLYCTGELADSLADIDLYPIATILAARFARWDGARLELRTKDDKVDALLEIDHGGRTTIGFSLSPPAHVDRYEPGTASFDQRLEAARRCQRAGYPVALKLEPLILTSTWQQQYADALEAVRARLDVERLEHVSVGCLRWSEPLSHIPVFAKSHRETLDHGEWIEYRPGKRNGTVAYHERIESYHWMRVALRRAGIRAPIWWSLEQPELIAELENA